MLLKHASLDREETEKKLESITVLTVVERKNVGVRLWTLLFLSGFKFISFKLISSLINGGNLQMCAGTMGMLRKKFSM